MPDRNIKNLEDLGEAGQLVNDFKFVKKAYFDLKQRHKGLLERGEESVDDDYWEDENFEQEIKIFEKRKKLYDEAQALYKELKDKLGTSHTG